MGKKIVITFALVAGLALTACSSQEPAEQPAPVESSAPASTAPAVATQEPSEAPEPEASAKPAQDSPEYAYAYGMTFGKFNIPGEPRNDFIELMKRYDDELGEVYFITATVDNRAGDDKAWINQIRIYDDAGKESVFLNPVDLLDAMMEKDESLMDYDKEYMKYFDEFTDTVSMGELDEQVLISLDSLPSDIARVIVDTGLGNDVEAVTIEEAESQGYPLDF